jgi:hypothetical protein
MKNWTEEMEMVLISKTENYSNQEKENIHYEYLKNLIEKIKTDKLIIETDLQTKIEYVINEMPNKTNEGGINYTSKHLNEITNLQTIIAQKFNLVKKKQFTRQYRTLGISLGILFGLPVATAIGSIALGPAIGLPIGLSIGLIIGNRLDNKAIRENRVL